VPCAVFADAEDGDDVGVVQARRGLRLAVKALQVRRAGQARLGQDLEGDVPAERLLHRLVDDAHAAPADLPQDAVVAQLPGHGGRVARGRRGRTAYGAEFLEHDQGREQLLDLFRPFQVPLRELGEAVPVARAEALQDLLGELFQGVALGRLAGHGVASSWTGCWLPLECGD